MSCGSTKDNFWPDVAVAWFLQILPFGQRPLLKRQDAVSGRRSESDPPRMHAHGEAAQYACHVLPPRPPEQFPSTGARSDAPPAAAVCHMCALDQLHRVWRQVPKRRVTDCHQQIAQLDIVQPMAQPVDKLPTSRRPGSRYSQAQNQLAARPAATGDHHSQPSEQCPWRDEPHLKKGSCHGPRELACGWCCHR